MLVGPQCHARVYGSDVDLMPRVLPRLLLDPLRALLWQLLEAAKKVMRHS